MLLFSAACAYPFPRYGRRRKSVARVCFPGLATPSKFLRGRKSRSCKEESIMRRKPTWSWAGSLLALAVLLSACGGAAQGPTTEGKFQIPAVEDGKLNVAMILIGP